MEIQAVEMGTARALARGFGGKVKPLPRWGDVDGKAEEEEPEWIQRFKAANPKNLPVAD